MPEALWLEVTHDSYTDGHVCVVQIDPVWPFWARSPVFREFVMQSPGVSRAYKKRIEEAVQRSEAAAAAAHGAPQPVDDFTLFAVQHFGDDPLGLPKGPKEATWRLAARGDPAALDVPWMGPGSISLNKRAFYETTPAARQLLIELARTGRVVLDRWFDLFIVNDIMNNRDNLVIVLCSFRTQKVDILRCLAKAGRADDIAEYIPLIPTALPDWMESSSDSDSSSSGDYRVLPHEYLSIVKHAPPDKVPVISTIIENHILSHPASEPDLRDYISRMLEHIDRRHMPALFRVLENQAVAALQDPETAFTTVCKIARYGCMCSSVRIAEAVRALDDRLCNASSKSVLSHAICADGASDATIAALTVGMTRRQAIAAALVSL